MPGSKPDGWDPRHTPDHHEPDRRTEASRSWFSSPSVVDGLARDELVPHAGPVGAGRVRRGRDRRQVVQLVVVEVADGGLIVGDDLRQMGDVFLHRRDVAGERQPIESLMGDDAAIEIDIELGAEHIFSEVLEDGEITAAPLECLATTVASGEVIPSFGLVRCRPGCHCAHPFKGGK